MLSLRPFDVAGLAEKWRAARPFAHVVVDDVVDAPSHVALREAMAAEPHWPNRSELFEMMASAEDVAHPTLRAFTAALAERAGDIGAISGHRVTRVELRSYVYMPGDYLLPHTDWRPDITRRVAFVYYCFMQDLDGGELDLFDVTLEDGAIVATTPSVSIVPRDNRLVLFDVSASTLHQVREVLRGARLSLAGWFHA